MAITAENIVVSLQLKSDQYNRDIKLAEAKKKILEGDATFKVSASLDENSIKSTQSKIGGLGATLGKLTGIAAGLGIAEVLRGGAVAAIDAAAAFETTTASFQTLLGSVEEAEILIKALDEFSVLTPFEPAEIQQSAKTLLSFGRSAQQVQEDIELIGEASAATGADLQSLAVVFGQVAAVNKLQGGDALQFINQGIPVYDILATKLKVSVGEVKKLQEQGKISFKILRDAFADATKEGGKFSGALRRQSETLTGLRSTLSGVQAAILKAFGSRILEPIKNVTREAISFGKSLLRIIEIPVSEKLKDEQQELNGLVTALTSANISENERSEIISTIETKYPSFLRNKSVEAATERELRDALVQSNKEYEARIVLQQLNEAADKQRENVNSAVEKRSQRLFRLSQALVKSQQILGGEIKNVTDAFNQFEKRGETVFSQIRGQSEFRGETVAITKAFDELQEANASLSDADRKLLREQDKLNDSLGQQADQLNILKTAFPELFAELERIRTTSKDIAESPQGVTGVDTKKIAAQAGSIAAIQKQISELQKTINETSATAPEQLGYARSLDGLKKNLEEARQLLGNLLRESDFSNVNVLGFAENADPLVRPQNGPSIADREALAVELETQSLLQKQSEIAAVRENESVTEIKLQGLRDRRDILLNSEAASASDFLDLSLQIAEAEIAIAKDKADKELQIEKDAESSRKELIKERVELANRAKDVLLSFGDQLLDQAISRKDLEIAIQQERLEAITSIADRGNAEQLQLEEERLSKITEEREKFVQRKRQLAAAEIAIENAIAIAGAIRQISTSTNPIDLALRAILIAATVASTAATISNAFGDVPSFKVGTEYFDPANPDATGGGPAILHKGERVLTAGQNAKLKGIGNDAIPGLVAGGIAYNQMTIPKSVTDNRGINTVAMESKMDLLIKQNKRLNRILERDKTIVNIDPNGIYVASTSVGESLKRKNKLRR